MKIGSVNLAAFSAMALLLTGVSIWKTQQWEKDPSIWQLHDRSSFYAPREYAWKLYLIEPPDIITNGTMTPERRTKTDSENPANRQVVAELQERLTSVFDKRFEQYKANLDALADNLWHQLLFIAAGIIVVFKRDNRFKIPVVETDVPVRWVYWAIPICLSYLWLRFGFLLNELIDARIVLWKTADAMQCPQDFFANPSDYRKALYTFSYDPAVYDGGYPRHRKKELRRIGRLQGPL